MRSVGELQRRDERPLDEEFERARPGVLGAFCDAISVGLRRWPEIELAKGPRMADFARWVTAAEPALGWEQGSFMKAYWANLEETAREAMQDDPVIQCLKRYLNGKIEFEETATDLLAELRVHADKLGVLRSMPKAVNGLSRWLKRIEPNIEKMGIHIRWDRAGNAQGDRIIRVWKDYEPEAEPPVAEALDDRVGPLMQEAGRP